MPKRTGYRDFYWRSVAGELMLVCLTCEREGGTLRKATMVSLVKDGQVVRILCRRCGATESLRCPKCDANALEIERPS